MKEPPCLTLQGGSASIQTASEKFGVADPWIVLIQTTGIASRVADDVPDSAPCVLLGRSGRGRGINSSATKQKRENVNSSHHQEAITLEAVA